MFVSSQRRRTRWKGAVARYRNPIGHRVSSKKRQHFVPQFLLRRFALTDGRWQGHIFRHATAGGAAHPAVPRNEAAKNRYYDLPEELVGEFQPETVLEKIESGGAAALQRLERRQPLADADGIYLAYFAALQTNRTPQDRAEARFLDEFMASQFEELRFSARDQAVAHIREQHPNFGEEEAEAERQRILDDLDAGRLQFESTPEREVASMFLGLNEAVAELLNRCDFTLVEFSGATELVMPDTGYTRYDPHPRVPGGGSGFVDTSTVETVIPVAPSCALVITSGDGKYGYGEAGVDYVEDLNLRAYAQSAVCIYGRGQQAVVAAQQLARSRRADVIGRRRRPRTLWILEGQAGEPRSGPVLGKGYSIEGVRTEWFDVDPRARDESRALRPADLWR
jgi:hypothetical protein